MKAFYTDEETAGKAPRAEVVRRSFIPDPPVVEEFAEPLIDLEAAREAELDAFAEPLPAPPTRKKGVV